jgi:hypothetical protein
MFNPNNKILTEITRINEILYGNHLQEQAIFPIMPLHTQKELTQDPHLFLDIASLITFFIPGVGPFVSTGLELTNAYLYLKENKKNSAGLALAFAIIPQIISAKIPIVGKYGMKYFEKILEKSTKGGVITKAEREAWDQLMKYQKWIKSESTKKILSESFKHVLKNFRFVDIVRLMWLLKKRFKILYSLSKFVIVVGGISYGWDKLAEIYGIVDGEVKNPKLVKSINQEYNKNNKQYKDSLQQDFNSIAENLTIEDSLELVKLIKNNSIIIQIDDTSEIK